MCPQICETPSVIKIHKKGGSLRALVCEAPVEACAPLIVANGVTAAAAAAGGSTQWRKPWDSPPAMAGLEGASTPASGRRGRDRGVGETWAAWGGHMERAETVSGSKHCNLGSTRRHEVYSSNLQVVFTYRVSDDVISLVGNPCP